MHSAGHVTCSASQIACGVYDNESGMHVQDLAVDNDKERQEMLLERMIACSNDLHCQLELSTGEFKWVLDHKTWCVSSCVQLVLKHSGMLLPPNGDLPVKAYVLRKGQHCMQNCGYLHLRVFSVC